MSPTYLVVAPRRVLRRPTVSGALALATAIERAAKVAHGVRAGADCGIIAVRGDSLEWRGLACGRRLIGRTFGCQDYYVARARAALASGDVS